MIVYSNGFCAFPHRTRVVSPVMDVIDWQTFQYNATQWPVRGVFDWRLDFHWESNFQLKEKEADSAVLPVAWVINCLFYDHPVYYKKSWINFFTNFFFYLSQGQKHKEACVSFRSPVLGGGVVVIDRHFYHSVGGYDPGMLLWGGEQIELSIRVKTILSIKSFKPHVRKAQRHGSLTALRRWDGSCSVLSGLQECCFGTWCSPQMEISGPTEVWERLGQLTKT